MTESISWMTVLSLLLGSSLLTTIFSKVFDYFTHSRKTTQILLLSSLEQICDKISAQGYRTTMQTLRLSEVKDQYKKLGGDGYADAMYNDAIHYPLQTTVKKGEGINDL